MALSDCIAFPFTPPALPGFGAAGGFSFVLKDLSGNLSVAELGDQVSASWRRRRKRPELTGLFTVFDPRSPQIQLDIDREKVSKLGVPITDVFNTLQASLGGAYVNDFNRFGRLYRVFVQAEADYRQKPDDIGQFYVRSTTSGQMIPLSTLVDVQHVSGTEMTTRYNLARAVDISRPRRLPGYSSAQAMKALEEVAARVLPREMGYDFSGLSYQEKNAPNPLAHLRAGGGFCVPAPGGPLRKLVSALECPAGHAAGRARGLLRRLAAAAWITMSLSRWAW